MTISKPSCRTWWASDPVITVASLGIFHSGNDMTKAPDNSRDAVLARMPKTPPKPFTPKTKPKASPAPAATKAEIANQKRFDKTVIKRMRKR
jgi:hypothetical protein